MFFNSSMLIRYINKLDFMLNNKKWGQRYETITNYETTFGVSQLKITNYYIWAIIAEAQPSHSIPPKSVKRGVMEAVMALCFAVNPLHIRVKA